MNPDAPLDAPGVHPPPRPPYRPPVGLPTREKRGWRETAVAFALHALVVMLLLAPIAAQAVLDPEQGAGGAGPAGGGGGGNRGTGGDYVKERLQYIQVAPAPAPAAVVTPVVPPITPPVVKPPVTPPPPTPQAAAVTPAPAAPVAPAAAVTPGTGGGSGTDGSAGNGPGSGGGVGSGEGTGRGSATGPGTGGGPGTIYPPQVTFLVIPPQPVPRSVRGSTVIANFDVDERGNVLNVWFTETRDGGYNKKLRDTFRELRFRPATKFDGSVVRDTAQLSVIL